MPARRGEHEVRAGGERVEVELVAARDLHQQVELGVHRIFLHDLRVVRGRLRSKGSVHDGDATRRRRGHFGGIETRLRCGWHRTEAAVQPAAQPSRLQPYGSQHAACRVPCRVRNFDTLRHLLCWAAPPSCAAKLRVRRKLPKPTREWQWAGRSPQSHVGRRRCWRPGDRGNPGCQRHPSSRSGAAQAQRALCHVVCSA